MRYMGIFLWKKRDCWFKENECLLTVISKVYIFLNVNKGYANLQFVKCLFYLAQCTELNMKRIYWRKIWRI